MAAAITQLALALERGDVLSLHVVATNPDRLVAELVEAGGRQPEGPVAEKTAGGLRWRQGLVRIGEGDGVAVLVASQMEPINARSPYAGDDMSPSLVLGAGGELIDGDEAAALRAVELGA